MTNTAPRRKRAVCNERCSAKYESYDPEHPQLTVWAETHAHPEYVESTETVKAARPCCDEEGCPSRATKALIWDLPTGRQWRFACDDHAETGPKPYFVAALLGVNP
jgi:hypothetical protein